MDDQPIILFDGVCNLCNAAVQYVIKHDHKSVFKFATLQGNAGQLLLKKYDLSLNDFNSFVLITDQKAYTRSSAALQLSKKLNGFSKLFYGFIIVPPFIRNAVYDLVARKRYQWFGKKDACLIPTKELMSRFLN